MLPRLLIAGFLLAHGALHASFLSPRPAATAGGPPWPFELDRSWILTPLGGDPVFTRILGLALVALTVAGFGLAAIAVLGWLPVSVLAPSVALGAIGSLALLGLFFHPWLIAGVAIDLAALWAVRVAGWVPE